MSTSEQSPPLPPVAKPEAAMTEALCQHIGPEGGCDDKALLPSAWCALHARTRPVPPPTQVAQGDECVVLVGDPGVMTPNEADALALALMRGADRARRTPRCCVCTTPHHASEEHLARLTPCRVDPDDFVAHLEAHDREQVRVAYVETVERLTGGSTPLADRRPDDRAQSAADGRQEP